MKNIFNYALAGILAYSALAPLTVEATSSYSLRSNNYKPQINSEEEFNGPVIVRGVPAKITDLPLELLADIPVIEEIKSTPKPYSPNFMPTQERLKAIGKK